MLSFAVLGGICRLRCLGEGERSKSAEGLLVFNKSDISIVSDRLRQHAPAREERCIPDVADSLGPCRGATV